MSAHPGLDRLREFAVIVGSRSRTARHDRVARHLEECGQCRRTIGEMRDVIAVARTELAPPAPSSAFARILERRAAGDRVILPVEEFDEPRGGAKAIRRALPWVVGGLLVAGAAAAAVPGSPFREWLAGLSSAKAPASSTSTAPSPAPLAEDTAVAGVSIALTAGDLWVSVRALRQPTTLRLQLTDGNELDVRGLGAAAGAVFQPRATGVSIDNDRGGEIHIDVPRALRRFELRQGATRLAVKEGERLTVLVRADTISGNILIRIAP